MEFIYSGTVVTELRDNGIGKLSVEWDNVSNTAKALSFNGKRIKIELDQKPIVQNIAGQNLIGGISRSLKSLSPTEGTSKTFEFTVNAKMQPTINITDVAGTKKRLITWDPSTHHIISDNEWLYEIASSEHNNSGIKRTNNNNESEYWFEDMKRGQTIVQGRDGIRFVTTRFLNGGILNGKVRSTTQTKDNVTTVLRKCDYNEKGQLIREFVKLTSPHVFTFKYNLDGKQTEIDVDGKMFCLKKYDAQGRLVAKTLSSGVKKTFDYMNDGINETITSRTGKEMHKYFASQVNN